jgi:hypothetical protein
MPDKLFNTLRPLTDMVALTGDWLVVGLDLRAHLAAATSAPFAKPAKTMGRRKDALNAAEGFGITNRQKADGRMASR